MNRFQAYRYISAGYPEKVISGKPCTLEEMGLDAAEQAEVIRQVARVGVAHVGGGAAPLFLLRPVA